MVYRTTIFVKIVFANVLWIRSMNVIKWHCQASSRGCDGLFGWPSVADRRQGLATAWRPLDTDSLAGQAMSGHDVH